MKALQWAWVPLFLGSCISISISHGGGTVGEHVQAETRARAAMQAAAAAAAVAKLHRYVCQGARVCYPVREVDARVEAIGKQLQSLPDEAVALKLWLADSIRDSLQFGQPLPMTNERIDTKGPQMGYDASLVDAAFAKLRAVLGGLLSRPDLSPDVNVISTPIHAELRIQVGSGPRSLYTTTTNGRMENVWLGVYTGSAKLGGYKDAPVRLDLINGTSTTIRCRLAANNRSGESSSCGVE